MQQDFFKKLMDIFHICEDLENLDGLHMIYKIVRGISQYLFWFYLLLLPAIILCRLILIIIVIIFQFC